MTDADAARPLPGAVDVLARLSRRYGRVGVISGRPASFLLDHLGTTGARLAGLYGLEWVEAGRVVVDPEAEPWRAAAEEVAATTEAGGPPGAAVERKGLSITIHFRAEPGLEAAVRAWAASEAARTGLVVHDARMSVELRPPVRRDKGTVVAEEAAGARAACFVGDDRGDLPAFDALDRLAAGGAHVVRVGVRSGESPAELLDRADVVVDGPEGALRFLRRLADAEPL